MKALVINLSIFLAALLIFAGYVLIGGTLSLEASVISSGAADYQSAYDTAVTILNSGDAYQEFGSSEGLSIENAGLIDVTITLKNSSLFDAGWVSANLVPAQGDVAVYYASGDGITVQNGSTGQINLKILTAGELDAARQVEISYYILGIKRTAIVGF